MKIVLLNAPGGSHYDGPMMSIPALVGQLQKHGYNEIIQRDLDLDLYYYTLKPDTQHKIIKLLKDIKSSAPFIKKLFVRLFGKACIKRFSYKVSKEMAFLEAFRNNTPIHLPFEDRELLRFKKGVNQVLKLMAIYYYPYLAYPRFFSLFEKRFFSNFVLKIPHTFDTCCDHGERALTQFYEEEVIPPLLNEKPDIVGISISFKHQLAHALLLTKTLRQQGVSSKIVLGGSYVTTTLDADWFEGAILKNADFAICSEGEEAFPKLLKCLEEGGDLDQCPNLIYWKDNKVEMTKKVTIKDMNDLAAPSYDGLDLTRYLERPVRLPLMTCRGCYWGRCTYCSHHWTLGSGKLRTRRPEKLFEDIKTYQEKYGTSHIYFTDEAVHPDTIETLSKMVIDSKFFMRWVGMLRFEEKIDYEFLKMLRQAGCHAIMFGLESVSEHVQGIINKGIKLESAHRILEDCRRVGIKVHIFIMLGIPGETEEDMQANLDFLRNKTHLYETVQLAPFQLMVGSPMYRKPEKFGIQNIKTITNYENQAFNEIRFETNSGLSREDVARHMAELIKDKLLFKKDLWEGYAYRLYQDNLPSEIHPS